MDLPIYELLISPEPGDDHEVSAVAFVDAPAIERNFLAFNEAKPLAFASINEDERVVIGPAMIPDMPIYRNDPEMGEYFVKFSRPTIADIAEKFFTKDYHKSANIMHQSDKPVDGVVFFQSFVKDDAKGVQGLAGDYPEGTWFLGAKVNNDDLWNEIKAGKLKGFSVEGLFKYKRKAITPQEAFEAIRKIINQL